MQIELGNRIAILIWLSPLDSFAACPGRDLLMSIAASLAQVSENFHQRLTLHPPDCAGRQTRLAFSIFVEHSFVEQLLQHFRRFIVRIIEHLLNGFHRLLAVLHDELHELIEIKEFILGGKFRAVEFAVEVFHEREIIGVPAAQYGIRNR